MTDSDWRPFTHAPNAGPYVIFPTHAHQILSNCIHIVGASILAFCFARRSEQESLFTRHGWSSMTWTKFWVLLLFFDSWFFLVFSGVLVNGVGLSYSELVCGLGIYACIFFYAGSKAIIYIFLVERVWIVWSAGNTLTRRQSRVYQICALVIFGYTAVFTLLFVGRVIALKHDGTCIIGLKSYASIPLLSYDLFINVFLTSMFIWPLYRENLMNPRIRSVAWRTLFAAAAALTTSSVNIAILTGLNGHQLGWVCLGSCGADVTMNALVLFWVTSGGHRDNSHRIQSLPTMQVPLSFVCGPNITTKEPTAPPASRPNPIETVTISTQDERSVGGVYGSLETGSYNAHLPHSPISPSCSPYSGALPVVRQHRCRCACGRGMLSRATTEDDGEIIEDALSIVRSASHAGRPPSVTQVSLGGSMASATSSRAGKERARRKPSTVIYSVGKALGLPWGFRERDDSRSIDVPVKLNEDTHVNGKYMPQRSDKRSVALTVDCEHIGHDSNCADCERTPVNDLESASPKACDTSHSTYTSRTRPPS